MLPKQLVVDIFTKQRILSKLGIYTQASKQILPETTQLRYSKRMKTAPQVLLLRAQLFTTGWSSQCSSCLGPYHPQYSHLVAFELFL